LGNQFQNQITHQINNKLPSQTQPFLIDFHNLKSHAKANRGPNKLGLGIQALNNNLTMPFGAMESLFKNRTVCNQYGSAT
jgi:hypothetical protein